MRIADDDLALQQLVLGIGCFLAIKCSMEKFARPVAESNFFGLIGKECEGWNKRMWNYTLCGIGYTNIRSCLRERIKSRSHFCQFFNLRISPRRSLSFFWAGEYNTNEILNSEHEYIMRF